MIFYNMTSALSEKETELLAKYSRILVVSRKYEID